MGIPWTIKRQMFFLIIFLAIVAIVAVFVFVNISEPTCFDGKQNQKEEGVDCGGPCSQKCLGEIREPIVLWSKSFKIRDGNYDVVSLVQNPNIFLSASLIKYQFKLYDKNNILITARERETFFNSNEIFPVFETNIETGNRIPELVFIEFEKDIKWKRLDQEKEKPKLVISKKEFFNTEPFPKLVISIANKSILNIDDIFAAAVLYDQDKNAKGVSVTKIDSIGAGKSYESVFTWPAPFSEEPAISEIFLRVGLEE